MASAVSSSQVAPRGSSETLRVSETRKSLSAVSWARLSTASRLSQYAIPEADTAVVSATAANTAISRTRSERSLRHGPEANRRVL